MDSPLPPSPKDPQHLSIAVAIAVLITALFWPVLSSGSFVLDDQVYVFENPLLRKGVSWESLSWALNSKRYYHWAPTLWISLLVDGSIWGATNAWGFHFGNVLLHAFASALLFLIALELRLTRYWALAAALCFGLHPISVEPVAWISSRKDCLAIFFSHLSLWLFLRGLRLNSSISALGFFIALTLGLGAKVTAFGLPWLGILALYLSAKRDASYDIATRRRFLIFTLLALVPALISVFLNGYAQRIDLIPGPEELLAWPQRFVLAVEYLARYLLIMLLPQLVSFTYAPSAGLSSTGLVVLPVLGACFWIGWRQRVREPVILMGLCWCLLFLLPYLRIFPVGNQFMANRWAYGALGGMVLTAFGLLSLISVHRRTLVVALGLGVSLIVSYLGVLSIQRWGNCLALTSFNAQQQAKDPEAWLLRASCEMRSDPGLAKESYRQALALMPTRFETVARLIKALPDSAATDILEQEYRVDRASSASAYFAQGMSCREMLSLSTQDRLKALLGRDALSCARDELRKAAEDPLYSQLSRYYLALLIQNQDSAEAKRLLEALHSELPSNTNIRGYLALLELRNGNSERAFELSQEAAALNEDNPLAWEVQAYVAMSQGQDLEAIYLLERVLLLSSRRGDIHRHLADLLDKQGAHPRAQKHREFAERLGM